MEMASEKLAAKYSFLYFSASGPGSVASLRDSQASSEVSPRALLCTCFHTRSANACDTPARSTTAWPILLYNSEATENLSSIRRVEIKTHWESPRSRLRWQTALSLRATS